MKIIELDSVDSTNEYCKRIDCGEDVVVFAKRQTEGRGTRGRDFISEVGGLYVTVMRHYTRFPASEAFKIMIDHCVAVCKTLEHFSLKPVIRWANDVLIDGKKICGTLIENTFGGGEIVRSVVGVGINVNNALPESLKDIATTITQHVSAKVGVEEVKKEFLKNIGRTYSVEDYKSYIDYFGKSVTLINGAVIRSVVVLDISADGRLIVKEGDKIMEISSAEVGLRV